MGVERPIVYESAVVAKVLLRRRRVKLLNEQSSVHHVDDAPRPYGTKRVANIPASASPMKTRQKASITIRSIRVMHNLLWTYDTRIQSFSKLQDSFHSGVVTFKPLPVEVSPHLSQGIACNLKRLRRRNVGYGTYGLLLNTISQRYGVQCAPHLLLRQLRLVDIHYGSPHFTDD